MKVSNHVRRLLINGHKPKELIQLGFSKTIVTRERRRLKKEKAALRAKASGATAQGVSHLQTEKESSDQTAAVEQELQSTANDLQKTDSLVESVSEVTSLMAVIQKLGKRKYETCEYCEGGLCLQATWTSEDEIPEGIGEPVHVNGENPGWYIKPVPLHCAICTATIEDRIGYLETSVSDNPLSGAKYGFTCEACGAKEQIAAAIMCTKCGGEAYWGWRSKKE